MKKLPRALVVLLAFGVGALGVRSAEPAWQFHGYPADDKGTRLMLRNADGEARWVVLGQQCEDYTVSRFDPNNEVVMLRKDGTEISLRLIRVKAKAETIPLTPEQQERVLENLRVLAAGADLYFVDHKKAVASYDELVGTRKYVKEDLVAVDGENYRAIDFSARKMEVRTNGGQSVDYMR